MKRATRLIFILLLLSAWCIAALFVFAAARAEATPAAYFPLVYGRQVVSSAPMALEAYPAPDWCDVQPSPCEG